MDKQIDRMTTYKPDWPEARARMVDWWAGRKTDRVAASVTAPRKGVARRPGRNEVPGKYTDPEVVFHNIDAQFEATFFGGEAFPGHWIYIGPVPGSAFLGCELNFREDTVWQARAYDGWDAAESVAFDRSNKWWRLACDLTRASLQRARGAYLVTGCRICAISDMIANMFGSEETLVATIERPETLRELRDRMLVWFRETYDETYDMVAPHQDGYFDWLHLWAPGRMATFQSDISCMLSPKTFNDLFLEEVRQEAKHVDHCFYHLDGPDAIKHLDALLSIEELHGIQWVPGAGRSNDPMDWLDLLRRVQAAGKKLLVYCPPDRVKPLLNAISRRGVYLSVGCRDEDQAGAVLKELARIGC